MAKYCEEDAAFNEAIKIEIVKMYQQFTEIVDPKEIIMDYMTQEEVVSEDQKELILNEYVNKTRRERLGALMNILLPSKHPRAFIILLRALEDIHKEVVEEIKSNIFRDFPNRPDKPAVENKHKEYQITSKNGQPVSPYLTTPLLVHTTPPGNSVYGIACLGGELFVVRHKASEMEVYDVQSITLRRRLHVSGLRRPSDMASSETRNSIYISDRLCRCVFRVELKGNSITHWTVDETPWSLCVGTNQNIIVTCHNSSKLKEFTPDGLFVREINLSPGIEFPLHAVQLPTGQLLVNHDGSTHRVCMINDAGCITESYMGRTGLAMELMKWPDHLCVDKQGFVFVIDHSNNRVVLLSPTLTYVRELIPADHGLQQPWKMCLNETGGYLFIGEFWGGRVLVSKVKDL